MPNYVPGKGNPCAKIMIVGEAPGAEEDRLQEPFVGSAGNMLNDVLRYADIDRSECYITNVVKHQPPQNDLTKLKLIGRTIEEYVPQLIEELNTINPNVVFLLGNTSLKYITGITGILNYRGSILRSKISRHKCVAGIHPAAILHSTEGSSGGYTDLFLLKQDAKRVKVQSLFPEINRPSRTITIARSSNQVRSWIDRNKHNSPNEIIDKSKYVNRARLRTVVDVETFKTFPSLIGLACNSWDAISIPMLGDGWPASDVVYTWRLLAEFLDECDVIGQNLKFDFKRCRSAGFTFKMWFDVMQAWHTLGFSEIKKDLGTLVSLLTEEPYYKGEGKEYNPLKDDISVWQTYNAKDCYSEWECYERLHEMLIEENMEEFFFDNVCPLNDLYERIEDIGILVDEVVRKKISVAYKTKLEAKQIQVDALLTEITGEKVEKYNADSPKQVAEMLYGQLRIPARQDVGEDTLKSLVNNVIKDPFKKKVVELTMELRKLRKARTNYIDFALSEFSMWQLKDNI